MRKLLGLLAVAIGITTSVFADVFYQNDFTTRISQEPIPAYGVVQTAQPYPAKSAFLCNRPSGNAGTYDAASLATYFNEGAGSSGFSRPGVDGWFLPYFNNIQKLVPRYLIPSNSEGYADTPVFTWSYGVSTTPRYGYTIAPLHNEFTNGQLRIQVDLKAPIHWDAKSSWFKVFPVYRKYMDILAWNNDQCDTLVTPGKFGFRATGGNTAADLFKTYPNTTIRETTAAAPRNAATTTLRHITTGTALSSPTILTPRHSLVTSTSLIPFLMEVARRLKRKHR